MGRYANAFWQHPKQFRLSSTGEELQNMKKVEHELNLLIHHLYVLGVVPRDPHHRDPWGKSQILIPHSLGKILKIPWGKMGKIGPFLAYF